MKANIALNQKNRTENNSLKGRYQVLDHSYIKYRLFHDNTIPAGYEKILKRSISPTFASFQALN